MQSSATSVDCNLPSGHGAKAGSGASRSAERLVRRCLATASLGALLFWIGPVSAQAQGTPSVEGRKPGLEEIVVTARKRVERLQDTPVSVTALTASSLDDYQVTKLSQVADITPNLTFDSSAPLTGSSSSSSIYIRGVGSSEFALSTDPGVGVYVDGVYLSRSIGSVLDVVDPERIEVLRGPQGTLFGRNTIGGAINVVSKTPASELGGRARLTFGSDSLSRWEGAIDLPASETLLTRWSFVRTKQDGYVKDRSGVADFGDEDSWSARGTVEWLLTDTLSLSLRGDATRESQSSAPSVLVGLNPLGPPDPATGMPMPSFVGGAVQQQCVMAGTPGPGCQAQVLAAFRQQFLNGPFATSGGFTTPRPEVNASASQPLQPKSELDVWGASATVNWELTADVSVKTISSYRRLDTFFNLDLDHSPLPILQDINDFDSDQTSHEIQLTGRAMDGRVNYTVGGYWFLENGDNKDVVDFLPGAIISGGKFRNQGSAGFGQATFSVTDQLEITAGARFSYEKKVFDTQRQQVLVGFVAPGPNGQLMPIPDPAFQAGADLVFAENKATNRDRALSPHLSVSYFWNDELMTYASYSEGFKGGGFQQRIFPARAVAPKFDKETARVYEVGVKTTALDGRLRLAGAAFYTDYEDLQIAVAEGIAPILANAGEARIRGLELEGQLLPLPDLRVDFGLGVLDGEYAEIDEVGTGVARGNELPNSPRLSAAAAVNYTFDLDSVGIATAQFGWSFRSDVENDAFNTPELGEDELNLYDASLTWESPDGDWRIILAGRNLTDRTYLVSGVNVPLAGTVEATYARGRTWTLGVERSF